VTFTIITDYEVVYSTPSSGTPPCITLLSSGNYIGQLNFHPNGTALPPDGQGAGLPANTVSLQYHLEDFENCAALLRNEKTVYLRLDPGAHCIQTAQTIPGT
jgi:hypothetical protein